MPNKKLARKAPRKTASQTAAPVYSSDMSSDAKLIIVLLLLLFFYPLGLVFMWLWMKKWPTWLKVVITLPIIIGILAAIFIIIVARAIIHEARLERLQQLEQLRQERQIQQGSGSGTFSLSPTPTTLPSINSNTY